MKQLCAATHESGSGRHETDMPQESLHVRCRG